VWRLDRGNKLFEQPVVDLRAGDDTRAAVQSCPEFSSGDLDALGDGGRIGVVETTTGALPPSSGARA
jgi:hypothetical protein